MATGLTLAEQASLLRAHAAAAETAQPGDFHWMPPAWRDEFRLIARHLDALNNVQGLYDRLEADICAEDCPDRAVLQRVAESIRGLL